MSEDERAFEDAFALGRANEVTIELARRHCLNMTFTEWGGQGLTEPIGLPINMRQVSCPVARGGAAMDLNWIASEFFELHRLPTASPHR